MMEHALREDEWRNICLALELGCLYEFYGKLIDGKHLNCWEDCPPIYLVDIALMLLRHKGSESECSY